MINRDTLNDAFVLARERFLSGQTLPLSARLEALKALDRAIRQHEEAILQALHTDLHKSPYEAYMTEVGLVLAELHLAIKKLPAWLKPTRVRTARPQMPGKTRLWHDPYGAVLIISPWNYPFQLSVNPLIGALAAGNSVILKPSAYSQATSEILHVICREAFPDGLVQVVQGGRAENKGLLELPFDYIFFTGSPAVGRDVMATAAPHLTPVTLELGGKSPVIVERSADLTKTAKRILFGKFLNAGQTCIAPDHILVEETVRDDLLSELEKEADRVFASPDYVEAVWPRIINDKHMARLLGLLAGETAHTFGRTDKSTRQLAFSLLPKVTRDSPVMREEIFGPLLPILDYTSLDALITEQKRLPKPLALYLFTNNPEVERRILTELSFGGGCVNDTVMHVSNAAAPFGGVGNSGMGAYHGRETFCTFSHTKTVFKKWWSFDLPVRYHPYNNPAGKLPESLLR